MPREKLSRKAKRQHPYGGSASKNSNETYIRDAARRLHNKLLYTTIAIDYLHASVENGLCQEQFWANSKLYLDTPLSTSSKTVSDLIGVLEHRGLISIGDYDVLKDIISFNVKVVQEIEDTELALKTLSIPIYQRINNDKILKDNFVQRDLIMEIRPDSGEPYATITDEIQDCFHDEISKIQNDLNNHLMKIATNNNRFSEFNKHFRVHNERLKESADILIALCPDSVDEKKEGILEMVKTSQIMMTSYDSGICDIHHNWKEMNNRLQESTYIDSLFRSKGMAKRKIVSSSIYIFLQAESVQHLDSFWTEYLQGTLTDEIRNQIGKGLTNEDRSLGFSLYINKENYEQYRKYIADGNEIVQPLTEVSVKLGGQDHTKFVCEVSHIETEVKWYLNQNEIIKERAYSMKQIGHEHILVMSPHERNEGLVTAEAGTVVASTDFIKNARRVVLVGRTGVGKSASGNTILGFEIFKSRQSSSFGTSVCKKYTSNLPDGSHTTVVDTPALFDNIQANTTIYKSITKTYPGPHIFLNVVSIGQRLGAQEKNESATLLFKTFGDAVSKHTIVLFTGADHLKDQTIEEYIKSAPQTLKNLLSKCNNRYFAINNKAKSNDQVKKLLRMFDRVIAENNGAYYTNDMYKAHVALMEQQKSKVKGQQEENEIKRRKEIENRRRAEVQRQLEAKKRRQQELKRAAAAEAERHRRIREEEERQQRIAEENRRRAEELRRQEEQRRRDEDRLREAQEELRQSQGLKERQRQEQERLEAERRAAEEEKARRHRKRKIDCTIQ